MAVKVAINGLDVFDVLHSDRCSEQKDLKSLQSTI